MANMTFKANLLPNSNLGYNLGSSSLKWNVYGDLKGNADTATALTSNAGSSTVPIYFSNGKPVQCSTTLAVSITGNAATATKLSNTPNNTTTFLRGDNTWTNTLTGDLNINGQIYYSAQSGHRIGSRHLDAGPASSWSDSRLYIGYGAIAPTKSIGFYYSADTSSRTQFAEINSNGMYANTRFGVNGQSTSYNFYVNGTTYMNNSTIIASMLHVHHTTYGSCIQIWSDSEGGNIFWRCAGSGGNASNTGYQIDTCSNVLRLYRTTNGGGAATHGATLMDSNGYASFPRVYGAVWNDYAEFRKTCNAKPGQCIIENGDGSLSLSTKRCQGGANIISDTFGFSIGKKDNYETPIAVSGRVLVYVDNKNDLKPGDALVSAPNGYCTKARWYEKILWPERIIGTVSEIPNYDIWYCGYDENEQRLVDNRIWVKVK